CQVACKIMSWAWHVTYARRVIGRTCWLLASSAAPPRSLTSKTLPAPERPCRSRTTGLLPASTSDRSVPPGYAAGCEVESSTSFTSTSPSRQASRYWLCGPQKCQWSPHSTPQPHDPDQCNWPVACCEERSRR